VAAKVKPTPRPFGAILVVIAVVGVAVIGYVVSRPTKVMTLDPSLPSLAAAGIVKGSPDAPVELIEFADFECPGCAYFATLTEPDVMNRLVATGQVRFRFMDFPLPDIHRNAVAAHNAAHCANEQGKFWEYHDLVFQTQDRWNGQATLKPRGPLKEIAQAAGLDVGKWEECYDSERMLPQILGNRREGERRRVGGTPTFIIGDQMFSNPGVSFDELKGMIDAEAAKRAAASAPAGKAPAPRKTP
jgi:protein-disulfide isomerase